MGYRRLIDCDQLFEDDALFEAIGNDGVLLYIRLWSLAEVWGGLEDTPKSISRQSGALDFPFKKVEKIIKKLIEMEKIYPYELAGKKFLWLKNLPKHQKMVKIPQSKLPLPDWISAESHEYDSKTCWSYKVIEDSSPQNRTSEELLQNVPRMTQNKPKPIQIKNKHKGKGADHRQIIRDQDKPVPLSGDALFFDFLKRFALKTCPECNGEGHRRLNQNWPCTCVVDLINTKAQAIHKDTFDKVVIERNQRCQKCLGLGVIFTGTREHPRALGLCDCKRPVIAVQA
jgi:hypothetical protein